MFVVKRNGQTEPFEYSKIQVRIQCLMGGLTDVDAAKVVQGVNKNVVDKMHTHDIDNLSAETCAALATTHPNYAVLGGRIDASNLQKRTNPSFSETTAALYAAKIVSEDYYECVKRHAVVFDTVIEHGRDMDFDFFAMRTLQKSYLFKIDGKIVERPQYMWMRVAVGIHKDDLDAVFETYDLLSQLVFTHATPTLFNAGTRVPQMSSCFLLNMREDSIGGIFETLGQCAEISKTAGGIGLAVHKIRAKGSRIVGTNGKSNGLIPMLRVYDATARYVDQGGGKRKGTIAVYLAPWHADIGDFLRLKRNQGKEENRARDLFYGLWIPDLFMRRLENDESWTLFCPNEAPGLADVWGEKFEALYVQYENENRGRSTMPARDLWREITTAQIETGVPYLLFGDACNEKSNQQNLGTIQCSNLCTEIVQFTSKDEIAVCNLASISLPAFLSDDDKEFDFESLLKVAKIVTRNLNKIIDGNFYPVPEARNSNERHRPIGVGVQGLADLCARMGIAFGSPEHLVLDRKIFETIYMGCVDASCELAERHGPYSSFAGSPASMGKLQFDLWNVKPEYDWSELKSRVAKHGLRNSLLTTVMPTASTSQIVGNNECIEAFTYNLYTRKTNAGDFVVINKWLVRDLQRVGLWTPEIRKQLVENNGSVQDIPEIPTNLKLVYRSVFEIPQKRVVELAAARGPFIDQSQSLNIHMRDATHAKLTALVFDLWKSGLKGMYYLRTEAKAKPQRFTVESEKRELPRLTSEPIGSTTMDEDEEKECSACSA